MSYECACQRSVVPVSVSVSSAVLLFDILILIYTYPGTGYYTVVCTTCSASHMYPEDIARYSTVVQLNL